MKEKVRFPRCSWQQSFRFGDFIERNCRDVEFFNGTISIPKFKKKIVFLYLVSCGLVIINKPHPPTNTLPSLHLPFL